MKLIQKNITDVLATAIPTGRSELRIFDEDLPGFGLRLRRDGRPTWIIQYRLNGKSSSKSIGLVAKLKASVAREAAEKDLAKVELDVDPRAEKRAARHGAADTFKNAVARYIAYRANPPADERKLKPRSFSQTKAHLTEYWKALNQLPVRTIGHHDVARILEELKEEKGPYAARYAKLSLSRFFKWAMSKGLAPAGNPVAGMSWGKPPARSRVLSDQELVGIWHACRDDDHGRIVRLLILTGQRREEVGGVSDDEIEWLNSCWHIPESRTKNSLPHEVPLPTAALAILREAPRRHGKRLVFGSRDASSFSGWSRAKTDLDQRILTARRESNPKATLEPWRLHDVRRTVATGMAKLGVQPHVIEACLNHVSGHKANVAGIYNRWTYFPEKRQAFDLWAAHVGALLDGKSASNVVALKA